MSKVEVDQVDPQSGTTLTLGTSGDTVSIPSGVTLANAGTATGFPAPTSGIAASAIDSGTIATARLGSGTASSSTFLRGDQTFAAPPAGGLTEADQWRLTANQSAGTNAVITANLERVDTDGFGLLGTGLTNSSGVFSFPSTGYYLIMCTAFITAGSNHNDAHLNIQTTTDNSNYDNAVKISAADGSGGSTNYSVHGQFLFDVTNVSTHKFRLQTQSMSSSFLNGDTAKNETHFTTLRLADT